MLEEKEKRIIEQRTIEATRKGYMGPSGKLGFIARYLGNPIIGQDTGTGYSASYLESPLDFAPPEWDQSPSAIQARIPYMETDGGEEPTGGAWRGSREYSLNPTSTSEKGWLFDGLSSGMHLEIKLNTEESKLLVNYKGYLVYEENSGELSAYVPMSDWESIIDKLYLRAAERHKKESVQIKAEKVEMAKKNRKNWINQLKTRWGI